MKLRKIIASVVLTAFMLCFAAGSVQTPFTVTAKAEVNPGPKLIITTDSSINYPTLDEVNPGPKL